MRASSADRVLRKLPQIRGGDSGFPIQLVLDGETGRLVIRGINEGGCSCVDIDLFDLVGWLASAAPSGIKLHEVENAIAAEKYP
jgi:hypothetical protein